MENTQSQTEESAVSVASPPSSSFRHITHMAIWIIIGIILVGGVFAAGLKLRHVLWDQTRPIHFQPDLLNAMNWGNRVLDNAERLSAHAPAISRLGEYALIWKAYVGLYDDLIEHPPVVKQKLDYAPIRLAVAVLWAQYVRHLPGDHVQPWDDQAIAFMLRINLLMELVATAAVFGLVLYWTRRQRAADHTDLSSTITQGKGLGSMMRWMRTSPWGPWALASMAAAFLWFDPAVLVDSHIWPQWDIVVAAFFLTAALAISMEAALTAGLLLGIGCMWKGQILIVGPVLALWPLFAGQWRLVLRMGAGFIAGVALGAGPWLISGAASGSLLGLLLIGAIVVTTRFVKQPRYRAAWIAAVLGIGMFLLGWLMGGSFAWFKIGFIQGAGMYQRMYQGPATNLPAILHIQWHWNLHDTVIGPLTMGWLLKLAYAATLVLCAYGAARHARRNSAMTLVSLTTPWITMFALLGQMHERYLVYAAAATCAYVAVNLGMTLLHFLLSLMACIPMLFALVRQNPHLWPQGLNLLEKSLPVIAIMVLLTTVVCLYAAVATHSPWHWLQRRSVNPPTDPAPEY